MKKMMMMTIGNFIVLKDKIYQLGSNKKTSIDYFTDTELRKNQIVDCFNKLKESKIKGRILKVFILEPKSLFKVFKIDANDVWNNENIVSKISKIYPFINLKDFVIESLILHDRAFVWLYPHYYLSICKKMSDEFICFIPTSPFSFMSKGKQDFIVNYPSNEQNYFLNINYNSDLMFENITKSMEPSDVNNVISVDYFLNEFVGHLNSEDKMQNEKKNIKFGIMFSYFKPIFVSTFLLFFVLLSINFFFNKKDLKSLIINNKIEQLTNDNKTLNKDILSLNNQIKKHIKHGNLSTVYVFNKALQSKTDAISFTNADIIKDNLGYKLFIKGTAKESKDLNDFIKNLSNTGFLQSTLKQSNNDLNEIIFTTELNYGKQN